MHAIFAIGKNGEMGKNNDLLFRIKEDFWRFKRLTMGHPIIMGRNTFESLPGVLPGRLHIVLTSDTSYTHLNHNVLIVHNKEEVHLVLQDYDKYPFVIGGPALFELFKEDIDTYHITYVHKEFPEADVRTNILDKAVLKDFDRTLYISRNTSEIVEGELIPYEFVRYERHTHA